MAKRDPRDNLRPAPPAPRGNLLALKHGATSAQIIPAAATALMPAIYEAHEHLDPVRDAVAVERYATTYARWLHAQAWLESRSDPIFSNRRTGRVHPVIERRAIGSPHNP